MTISHLQQVYKIIEEVKKRYPGLSDSLYESFDAELSEVLDTGNIICVKYYEIARVKFIIKTTDNHFVILVLSAGVNAWYPEIDVLHDID